MKLSEYIKHLQDILDSYGDLLCIYSNVVSLKTRSSKQLKQDMSGI